MEVPPDETGSAGNTPARDVRQGRDMAPGSPGGGKCGKVAEDLAFSLHRGGEPALIFIHGLGATRRGFDHCFGLPVFRRFTLASVDLPGCGRSPVPPAFSFTMEHQALVLLEWVKGLGLDRIVILGHSMGGVIGLFLAEFLGPRVQAFFSLEGHLFEESTLFSKRITSLPMDVFERLGLAVFRNWLRATLQKAPSPGLTHYSEGLASASPKALYLSSRSLIQEVSTGHLNQRFLALPCAKYYVFGQDSPFPSIRRFLDSHAIPHVTVPGAGHFMMVDHPTFFYRKILEIMEKDEAG